MLLEEISCKGYALELFRGKGKGARWGRVRLCCHCKGVVAALGRRVKPGSVGHGDVWLCLGVLEEGRWPWIGLLLLRQA